MTITIGTRRDGDRYVGVLRNGHNVIAECGHRHANRDLDGSVGGRSARTCITRVVRSTVRTEIRDTFAAEIRQSWQHLTRGFQVPASTIAAARVQADADAGAFVALVGHVAHLLAAAGVTVELSRYGGTRLLAA
jgi:hypothetical protein